MSGGCRAARDAAEACDGRCLRSTDGSPCGASGNVASGSAQVPDTLSEARSGTVLDRSVGRIDRSRRGTTARDLGATDPGEAN